MDGEISALPSLRLERIEPTISKRRNQQRQNEAFDDNLRQEENDDENKGHDARDARHRPTPDTRPTPRPRDTARALAITPKETHEEHIDYEA